MSIQDDFGCCEIQFAVIAAAVSLTSHLSTSLEISGLFVALLLFIAPHQGGRKGDHYGSRDEIIDAQEESRPPWSKPYRHPSHMWYMVVSDGEEKTE